MPEPEVTILANLPVHHAIHARSRMHSARWTRMPCMPAWPPPPAVTGAASTIRPSAAWKRVLAPPMAPLSSSWRKSGPCAKALAPKALIQPTSMPPGARAALDRRGYQCAGLSASTRSPNGAGGDPVACSASVGCITPLAQRMAQRAHQCSAARSAWPRSRCCNWPPAAAAAPTTASSWPLRRSWGCRWRLKIAPSLRPFLIWPVPWISSTQPVNAASSVPRFHPPILLATKSS